MLKLDPDDPEDEENVKVLTALNSSGNATNTTAGVNNTVTSSGPILTEADQVTLANYMVNMVNVYFW